MFDSYWLSSMTNVVEAVLCTIIQCVYHSTYYINFYNIKQNCQYYKGLHLFKIRKYKSEDYNLLTTNWIFCNVPLQKFCLSDKE